MIAGNLSAGATLVPIPNTIVKPCSADGTPIERSRESRPLPAPLRPPSSLEDGGLVFLCPPANVDQKNESRSGRVMRDLRAATSFHF